MKGTNTVYSEVRVVHQGEWEEATNQANEAEIGSRVLQKDQSQNFSNLKSCSFFRGCSIVSRE